MKELRPEVVRPEMLRRRVDPTRYRGLVRPDKTVKWTKDQLEQVERLRGQSSEAWPRPTALPKSLGELGELLTTLGWEDLAALAHREELMIYREMDAARPGVFTNEIRRALAVLFSNLIDARRYDEALEVVNEQLRLSSTDRSSGVAARDAEYWRMVYWRAKILARLGRRDEAAQSTAVAVNEVRGPLGRLGDASANLELSHVLALHADQLDSAGRVAEAADMTAEVVAYWRERPDSTDTFASMVDLLSERLVRSERAEEAGVCLTEAIEEIRHREDRLTLARIWHSFSARLLSLGLPNEALAAIEQAVNIHRESVRRFREGHRQLEAVDEWDWYDDQRYDEDPHENRRRELESSLEAVHKAERDLHDELLNLSACLRRLDRVDEATAASAKAATISKAHAVYSSRPRDSQ
ncbi:hypothetical protein [Actinoallomurus sp. CA-150999]|uniref:hypothetical protein n=1 Tax=Actinoallomurus sp. CA-150999 TaxID=3239887 RepID=UPI003D9226F0